MEQNQIKGKFDQLRSKIKETWGKLSDSDISLAESKRDEFFGKLKETYGLAKDDAEKRLGELEKACECGAAKVA